MGADGHLSRKPSKTRDDDVTTFHGGRGNITVGIISRHHIEDDVNTVTGRCVPAGFNKILIVVIYHEVCSQLAAHLAFLLVTGRSKYGCAKRFCQLDGRRADTTAAAVD